jgi:hypothetical protein
MDYTTSAPGYFLEPMNVPADRKLSKPAWKPEGSH